MEVVALLSRKSGALEISLGPFRSHYQLYVADGSLRGMVRDHSPVEDALQAREEIVKLFVAQSGSFEFTKLSPESLVGNLDLPLQRILLSISTMHDEIGAFREHFADPRTQFRATQALEESLDPTLSDFWQRSHKYFSDLPSGISAQQLSSLLRISLEQAQLYLYKLRAAGLVAPIRAVEQPPKNHQPLAPSIPASAPVAVGVAQPSPKSKPRSDGLIPRLLQALKGKIL